MKYNFVLIVNLLLIIPKKTHELSILVLFPHPAKSHFDSFGELFKKLSEKGHTVTVISHFPLASKQKNYTDIRIDAMDTYMRGSFAKITNLTTNDPLNKFQKYSIVRLLADVGKKSCEVGFSSKAVQDFLKEKNQFDITIVENFNSDCFVTVAKLFNVPIVRLLSTFLMPWSNNRYGNPSHPAYIPNYFMPFSDEMSFFERVENTLIHLLHTTYFNWLLINRDQDISLKYFGNQSASLNSDILKDSLLLVTSHFSVNLPRPLVPNIVEIGGIHLKNSKSLPKVSNKFSLINVHKHIMVNLHFTKNHYRFFSNF